MNKLFEYMLKFFWVYMLLIIVKPYAVPLLEEVDIDEFILMILAFAIFLIFNVIKDTYDYCMQNIDLCVCKIKQEKKDIELINVTNKASELHIEDFKNVC